jgi:hypothetical protein
MIDLELELARTETSPQVLVELTKPKRGPGRPKGSRTRPRDQAPPSTMVSAIRRPTRIQTTSQRAEEDIMVFKKRRMGEPEDTMDEQPDDRNWFDIHLPPDALPQDVLAQEDPHQDDPHQDDRHQDELVDEFIRFTNDVTTINDTDITPEPGLEDLDPESPEYRKLITLKYNRARAVLVRSSPPVIMTDAPTIEDTNDEVWHEASERSDDEQPPQ